MQVRNCNTPGVLAIGLIVEAATGRNYEGQLQEQVYGPLGLKKTKLPAGPNLIASYIHGYDNDPKGQPPEDYSELVAAGWASGGMVSTPTDLNDFIRSYVGGDLFGPKTLTRQRRAFKALTRAEERAVCAALADR